MATRMRRLFARFMYEAPEALRRQEVRPVPASLGAQQDHAGHGQRCRRSVGLPRVFGSNRAKDMIDTEQRRLVRRRRNLAAFRHALKFFEPISALGHTVGFYATLDAVRRVASTLIQCYVKDVEVAWQIVYYVRNLPDGSVRLQAAVDQALSQWELDCEAKAVKA